MPTQTFLNLNNEKKNRLINVAKEEFSKVPFHEVSINIIIDKANISRGSFYMYFKDKEDLFEYLLCSHKKKFSNIIIDNLKKYDGDLKEAFINIFDELSLYIEKNNSLFFKNVFLSMNYKTEKYIIPHNDIKEDFDEFKKYINIERLNIKDTNDIKDIFDLIISIMLPTIIHTSIVGISHKIVKEKYLKKLNLICEGIYRKD